MRPLEAFIFFLFGLLLGAPIAAYSFFKWVGRSDKAVTSFYFKLRNMLETERGLCLCDKCEKEWLK